MWIVLELYHLDVMYYVLIAAQCTVAFILTIIAFQILTNHEYDTSFPIYPSFSKLWDLDKYLSILGLCLLFMV